METVKQKQKILKESNFFPDETNIMGSSTRFEFQLKRHEAQENEPQEKRHEDDWLYLKKVKGRNRTATIGSKDIKV